MSGTDDKSQKTEQPTPQKLRKTKEQGQVAKSKDVTAFVTTLTLTLFIMIGFSSAWEHIMAFTSESLASGNIDLNVIFANRVHLAINLLMVVILPILGVALISAILANIGQIGFIFSTHPITPDISKLNPISGLKRIFGFKNFVDFLRSALKLCVLIFSIFIVVRDSMSELFYIVECGLVCITNVWRSIALKIVFLAVLVFFFLAVFDFWFQRYQFNKDQMMTRDEVKKDHKSSEGDPAIKSARKQIQRESAAEDIDSIVKESIIIILANTSLIALKYKYGETPLPILTLIKSKGQMRDIVYRAKKHEITIHEDAQLAKKIIKKTKLNEYIPAALISEVAGLFSKLSLV